jgi:hypothetical protein
VAGGSGASDDAGRAVSVSRLCHVSREVIRERYAETSFD